MGFDICWNFPDLPGLLQSNFSIGYLTSLNRFCTGFVPVLFRFRSGFSSVRYRSCLQEFFSTQGRVEVIVRRRYVVQAPARLRRRRGRRFVKDDDVFAADVDFRRRHGGRVVGVDRVFWLQLEREQDFATPADGLWLIEILKRWVRIISKEAGVVR